MFAELDRRARGDRDDCAAESLAQIDGLRSNSVYQAQPVVARGREVFLPPNGAFGAALSYNNVLSLPFAIDGMMPLLQAAVDGDPNTAVPAA